MEFQFKNIDFAMDFCKILLLENNIAKLEIKAITKEFPRESYFKVLVLGNEENEYKEIQE